jgi:hypothetical protein
LLDPESDPDYPNWIVKKQDRSAINILYLFLVYLVDGRVLFLAAGQRFLQILEMTDSGRINSCCIQHVVG